jgi:ribosomal protein L7Ae-like RNA K-turn-binding protein
MKLQELQDHIRTLATLEQTDSLVVSCYVNLGLDRGHSQVVLQEQAKKIRQTLKAKALQEFDELMGRIEEYLNSSRAGKIRERIDRVWSKKQYQKHFDRLGRQLWSNERYQYQISRLGKSLMKEMVNILDRLMSAGGHTHLVLAGDPMMTHRLLSELPEHLRPKLVDVVSGRGPRTASEVVGSAIRRFSEKEEQESQNIAEQLYQELRRGGLAVAGIDDSQQALAWGQVDVLVMTKDFDPSLRTREEMIRMAESTGCRIEIVKDSDLLSSLDGVGCLLRYRTENPERIVSATSF